MSYLRFKPGTNLLSQLPNLGLSILSKNKRAPQQKIRELQDYVKNNNLKWIPDSSGNGAYFVSNHVSKSLGKKEYHFVDYWKSQKLNIINNFLDYGISPKIFKLKNAELVQFKLMWKYYHSEVLENEPEIWIQEWSVAQSYISHFYRQLPPATAPAFNTSTAVLASSEDEYLFSDLTEENLKQRIIKLASYQRTIKLSQEMSVINTFKDEEGNTAKSRRMDMIEQRDGRYYIGYELKLEQITDEHIREALGHKGYLELLRNRFKGRKVKFLFMSPNGISPAAKRLIKNNPYVGFVSVQFFVDKLIKQVLKESDKFSEWYFKKNVFSQLFPENTVTLDISQEAIDLELEELSTSHLNLV